MSVIEKLASSLGRKDEVPNQELAAEIVANADVEAILELVEHLTHKKKYIQNDCIKVLYEVGEQAPKLIAPYYQNFLSLLSHKNNRLQWGAMTALVTISRVKPEEIYLHLPQIIQAADKGSVITRDHAVNILIQLVKHPQYEKDVMDLLFEQLHKCPVNQFPMYAERTMPIITKIHQKEYVRILNIRFSEMPKESMKKRLEKIINKIR